MSSTTTLLGPLYSARPSSRGPASGPASTSRSSARRAQRSAGSVTLRPSRMRWISRSSRRIWLSQEVLPIPRSPVRRYDPRAPVSRQVVRISCSSLDPGEVGHHERSALDGFLAEGLDQTLGQLGDVALGVAQFRGLSLHPLPEEEGEGLLGLLESEGELARHRGGAVAGEPDKGGRCEKRAVPAGLARAQGVGQPALRLQTQEGVHHDAAPAEELDEHRRQNHQPGELHDHRRHETLTEGARHEVDQHQDRGDPEDEADAAQQHGAALGGGRRVRSARRR